jgi:hypothetical protein
VTALVHTSTPFAVEERRTYDAETLRTRSRDHLEHVSIDRPDPQLIVVIVSNPRVRW